MTGMNEAEKQARAKQRKVYKEVVGRIIDANTIKMMINKIKTRVVQYETSLVVYKEDMLPILERRLEHLESNPEETKKEKVKSIILIPETAEEDEDQDEDLDS